MKRVQRIYGWEIWGIIVAIFLVSVQNGAAAKPENLQKFKDAATAYLSEDFPKAIALYEEIPRSGEESGPLYYNLGNSYFKTGQLGKAILNYERANYLMPRDADLRANYEYALSQTKNWETSQESRMDKWLSGYRNFFTLDELTLLIFLFFFLTGVVYFLGLFLKWPKKNYFLTLFLMCCVLFFHGYLFTRKYSQKINRAIVLVETPAKFEPLSDATTHFELFPGMNLKLLREEGDWFKVRRADGRMGWVKKEALERI